MFKPAKRRRVAIGLACASLGATAAAAPAHPDFTGVWAMKFREFVRTDDNTLPPMKPQVLAAYRDRVAKMDAGDQLADSATKCLPHGMPRIMYTPYPVQILQRPDVIGLMFEVNHNARLIYIDQKQPDDPDPTYMGYSVGHWDGPTLVVETIGLNDKIQIDRAGLPESESTKVVEHMRLIDGGKRLENKITVIDDTLYTAPWTFTVDYTRADYHLMEYVCDNNRDFARIENNK